MFILWLLNNNGEFEYLILVVIGFKSWLFIIVDVVVDDDEDGISVSSIVVVVAIDDGFVEFITKPFEYIE